MKILVSSGESNPEIQRVTWWSRVKMEGNVEQSYSVICLGSDSFLCTFLDFNE